MSEALRQLIEETQSKFKAEPESAVPELLNPSMNIGTGTRALRVATSSLRPRLIGPEERDNRVVQASDLA